MDKASLKKVLNCEDVVIMAPEALNINFEYLRPMINKKLKMSYHENEDAFYFGRDNSISMNMSKDVVYKLKTPNGHDFAMFLTPTMFGVNAILSFDRKKYFSIVRELKKLSKFKLKQQLGAGRNPNLPILDKTLIDEIDKNSIQYLNTLRKYRHLNLKGCRGLIFTGPPGNGKTMLCRHLMNQAYAHGYSVVSYNGANIDQAYAKNELSNLFNAGNFIFFDDVDINYFSRINNGKQSCSLLSAMDGLSKSQNSIRIFSTNEHIENMDAAFLRPGRIDKIYKFDKPTEELRKKFIEDWAYDELKLEPLDEIVKKTDDFSFAELAELRNELLLGKLVYDNYDLNATLSGMVKKSKDKKLGFK
jgi:ATP-dependent Zn protease